MLRRRQSFIVPFLLLALAFATCGANCATSPGRRLSSLCNVSDPQVSPDGNWVAYVVTLSTRKKINRICISGW